jgi:hypothetical protein
MSLAALFTTSVAVVSAAFAAAPQNIFTPQKREYEYCDKQIRDLFSEDYFQTICLRPEYQRHIRWKPEAMNNFIDSVMMKRYIMPILMYRLQPSDLIGKYSPDTIYESEVMDGQHRLYTLNAFKSSKIQKLPCNAKEFIVHWKLTPKDENGTPLPTVHIFYERTPDVENWCKEQGIHPEFLTAEGKKLFNNTVIKITTIVSKLTMNERRAEFMSLQNGIPVRGSDLLKNEVGCKLIVQLNLHDYEDLMMISIFPKCSKKFEKYWTNWVARFYMLHKDESTTPAESFLVDDKKISKMIKDCHSSLNPSDAEFNEFHDKFLDFIEFLSSLDESVAFNPTQLFAVFYYVCHQQCNHDVVRTYMRNFSKDGQVKPYKTMWENNSLDEPRRKYFNYCIAQLGSMQEPALPHDDRPIRPSLKKKVWEKCGDSRCYVCDSEIAEDAFEAGHIVARARGGQTELDNLEAMCFDCNRSMGIRDANEYKRDKYPQLV